MAERHAGFPFQTIALGISSLALYSLLFLFEEPLLALTTAGGWSFILPVLIAFLFSFVHGGFTSHFWDSLGIRAKPNVNTSTTPPTQAAREA